MASKEKTFIPYNKPAIVGNELQYMKRAVKSGQISGNGEFTKKTQKLLEEKYGIKKVLLTTSCTDALEMAAMLLDIKPGDEVIVPSFSFVSTANAFASKGAKPVFADVTHDTLNLDHESLEDLICERTKAIVPIHYAGVGAQMNRIMEIAKKNNVTVVEDAAQCVGSKFEDKYLGSIGRLGAFSFHETKNLHCGEGGALLINDASFIERGEIIWEKGTNRSKFFRGEVDKYTWVDTGSSFLMSDLLAAYLFAQLEKVDQILDQRRFLYNRYAAGLSRLEKAGNAALPVVPKNRKESGHIFYLLMESETERDDLIKYLRAKNIHCVFHYLPLHLSPMGKKFGGKTGMCPVTEDVSSRLVRLPLFHGLTTMDQDRVIEEVLSFFNTRRRR